MTTDDGIAVCVVCDTDNSTAPLKHCAKCKEVIYCSQDCQRDDWKRHKKVCSKGLGASGAGSSAPSGATGASSNVAAYTTTTKLPIRSRKR